MKMTHTPGFNRVYIHIHTTGRGYSDPVYRAEAEANGNLIAAASLMARNACDVMMPLLTKSAFRFVRNAVMMKRSRTRIGSRDRKLSPTSACARRISDERSAN